MTDIILIGDAGRLDFLTPIPMTSQQKDKFMALLNGLYEPIEEESVSEFRINRLGSKEIHAKWTANEYHILLQLEDYSIVAEKLGRTEMSIIMRTGAIVPKLISWCEEKGISFDDINLENIELFLKETEDKKIERRNQRKLRTQIANKIEKMLDNKEDPCMVGDSTYYGGECENGFHRGCITCPSPKGFIKTDDDIAIFNKVYREEFE